MNPKPTPRAHGEPSQPTRTQNLTKRTGSQALAVGWAEIGRPAQGEALAIRARAEIVGTKPRLRLPSASAPCEFSRSWRASGALLFPFGSSPSFLSLSLATSSLLPGFRHSSPGSCPLGLPLGLIPPLRLPCLLGLGSPASDWFCCFGWLGVRSGLRLGVHKCKFVIINCLGL